MKKRFALGLLGVMTLLITRAQDPNYNGPAKMYVKSFWNQVGILHKGGGSTSTITNLEKAMVNVKEKDPSYNTAEMEAAIKLWKEKTDVEAAGNKAGEQKETDRIKANKDLLRNRIKVQGLFDYLFKRSIQVGHNNLPTVRQDIDTYKAKAEELLSMDYMDIEYLKAYKNERSTAEKFSPLIKTSMERTLDTFIARKQRIMASARGNEAEPSYYELEWSQVYWDLAQKIFPQETPFAEAYQKITALRNKYGSLDQVNAQSQKNATEKIKNTKVPTAIIKDANLEKMFTDAFNKRYGSEYKGTVIKAVLLQSDWQTERNELTGIVTGRIRQGAIVYKGTDGKCYLVSVVHLYQEYIGSSFQNTKAVYAQNGQEMLCENVK